MKRLSWNVRFLSLLAVCASIAAAILTVGGPRQEAQRRSDEPRLSARYADFAKADRVTAEIKDPTRRLVRIDTTTEQGRKTAESVGTIVEDYGSFVVASALAERKIPRGADVLKTTVHLPGKKFDPLTVSSEDASAAAVTETSAADGYYIVQFGTVAKDELLDSLRDAGVEIIQYIPHQAFLVYGGSDAIGKAAAHSRVRWVGAHRPEHKISGQLRKQLAIARGIARPEIGIAPLEYTSGNSAKFNVAVVKRESLDDAVDRVANTSGGAVISASDLPNNYFNVVQIEASVEMVEQVAYLPGVVSIEPVLPRLAEDERSSQIVAGNYAGQTTISGPGYDPLGQFGVDGTNVTVAVSDDGITIPGNAGLYLTSANVVNGPGYGVRTDAKGGHGHLNASIIAGDAPFGVADPTGHNYGKGVAPKAHIINIPFLSNPSTDVEAANDAVTVAGPNGVLGSISNNSWGSPSPSNVYSSWEAEYDGFVRDASTAAGVNPLLLVFSAGNQGSGGLTAPKAAKNLLVVGNSENVRPEISPSGANNIDDVVSSSSRGPTADGRIKPDIMAPGGIISGSRAPWWGTQQGYSGNIDDNHVFSNGTSHAAPQIAGVAALFTQFWKNGHGGANPSPAVVKAAIINTGQEMTGTGATTPLPNGSEGWGRVNMKYMFNTGTSVRHFDQLSILGTVGNSRNYSGTVTDASKPVRVTLVWTDPPGVADPALVNNLDLTVTVGGNTYKGNVFSNGLSTTGGSADTLNNVENIWLPAGVTGPITATVTAVGLNGDGVLGNADEYDQNFALVFYNADVGQSPAADISGSVLTSQGRGVTGAIVTLTDNNTVTLIDVTGRNGAFQFAGLPAGRTYTISVSSGRFTFQPRFVPLDESVTGLNFSPSP